MNGKTSMDAPEFLQPDPQTEADYNAYLDEMAAARDAEIARMAALPIAPRARRVPTHPATQGNGALTRCDRVLRVLMDGQFHATHEFLGPAVGGSEGLRRLRELSSRGYRIERRKIKGRSSWEYRLVWPLP